MYLKSVQFFPLAILSCAIAAIDKEDVGNANDYIDKVLENLRKDPEITKHLDPLDINVEISDSKYKLKNLRVKGLSNLFREGDCSLSVTNETVNLVGQIAVRDLRVTMDYSAKALFFWIHGNAVVTVDHTAIKIDLSATDGNARVNTMKVVNLGPYRVTEINGGSFLLNWLIKIIANNAAQQSRGAIINALENEGKNALNNVLKQYKLPLHASN